MSLLPSTPPRILSSRRWRRRAGWIGGLVALALVIGTAGAGATMISQRDALARARADLASSSKTLAAALDRARKAGVSDSLLTTLVAGEHHTLAEPAVPPGLGGLDQGEIGHLGRQAAALRSLIGQVDGIEAAITNSDRAGALGFVDDYDAAIIAARNAGLDVAPDVASSAQAREALWRARTPVEVATAIEGLTDRVNELRQRTGDQVAADLVRAQAVATAATAQAEAAAAALALSNARTDASSALAQAQGLLTQAQRYPQLDVAGPTAGLAAAAKALANAQTRADFETVTSQARAAGRDLAAVVVARSEAYSDMASARRSVQDAINAKVDLQTVPAQLDALQSQLDAATNAGTFQALRRQITSVVAPLLSRTGIAQLGQGKLIVIDLARQHLTAFQDGVSLIDTPVTTGRPALPTPPGNYSVMSKNHPFQMISPWPVGSQFYYPPSWVQYVLWFRAGGYGIHDASWRSTYGPGTEAAGTHGCVNVPFDAMQKLYFWADTGTRVIVR